MDPISPIHPMSPINPIPNNGTCGDVNHMSPTKTAPEVMKDHVGGCQVVGKRSRTVSGEDCGEWSGL